MTVKGSFESVDSALAIAGTANGHSNALPDNCICSCKQRGGMAEHLTVLHSHLALHSIYLPQHAVSWAGLPRPEVRRRRTAEEVLHFHIGSRFKRRAGCNGWLQQLSSSEMRCIESSLDRSCEVMSSSPEN